MRKARNYVICALGELCAKDGDEASKAHANFMSRIKPGFAKKAQVGKPTPSIYSPLPLRCLKLLEQTRPI